MGRQKWKARMERSKFQMNLIKNFPMNQITSLGVGGPADYFCKPKNIPEIQQGLQYAQEHELPITIIGYGTNLLVTDKGIRGLVIQIADNFAQAGVEGTLITATSGCLFNSISRLAACHSLTGLEFAIGIPGSLGGAIYMNAGAYDGEIGPLIENITWATAEDVGIWDKNSYIYSYRYSRAQEEPVVIVKAHIRLEKGDQKTIYAKMKEFQTKRHARQPFDQPSAGSTFKRPEGYYVGPMIEKLNLKGYTIGGAQVSKKHAGFIINTGNATAQDILDLIAFIQKTVKEAHGIHLEPEIKIIGER